MKFKKDLIIVCLATFCLTATLFMAIPTRSANDPNYDPWIDNNEDGVIDIFDAIRFSNAFNTAGDPTKNVSVTNLPLDEGGHLMVTASRLTKVMSIASNISVNWTSGYSGTNWTDAFSTDNYGEMFIYVSITNWMFTYRNAPDATFRFEYEAYGATDGIETVIPSEAGKLATDISGDFNGFANNMSARFTVWSPQTRIRLEVGQATMLSSGWVLVTVSVYLRS